LGRGLDETKGRKVKKGSRGHKNAATKKEKNPIVRKNPSKKTIRGTLLGGNHYLSLRGRDWWGGGSVGEI